MPYVALLAVMAASSVLVYDRAQNLQESQQRLDVGAQTEFVTEIAISTQHLSSEIDRISELMMGVTAFDAASVDPPQTSVGAYVELIDARSRFPGLVHALAVSPTPDPDTFDLSFGSTDAEAGNTTGSISDALDASRPVVVRVEGEAQQPGGEEPPTQLVTALTEAVDAQSTPAPFITAHKFDNRSLTSVTFPLDTDNPEIAWASLVFASRSFLTRAIPSGSGLSVNLVDTGAPAVASATIYDDPTQIPVRAVGRDQLAAESGIDVFGTEFVLESLSEPGLLQRTSRSQLWILLGAGAAMAFGIYAALRELVRSRANALESARTADRDRAAIDHRLRTSFERAPIGMAEIDAAGRVVEINPALCEQAGEPREVLLGRPLSSLVHEADREGHIARVESLLNGSVDAVQSEHRFSHSSGRDVWVHESISVISQEAGSRSLLVQCQDITTQRQAAWELAQQALHDDLTGLPNRALFLNRLKHALVRANRDASKVAVMFIDIDRFKVVNDSLGHEMGDEFLKQIAARIGTALRSGDTVARFGGDEFVVLCESVTSESEASAAAQRIQSVFTSPFKLGDHPPTYATASVGITLSSTGESSADALLRDADAAMYRAKDAGRNRAEMFDHSMRSAIVARLEIESQLRAALQNGEIVMHFQAIVDPFTHVPVGYEALIRWNHPEKGLLGPGAFLPVAEEAGLIHLIDSFALRAACEHIASWTATYPAARDVYVATNWSARHLGRFLHEVEQVLSETGIDPHQLMIEVTEGFLLEDSDASLLALQELKQLGVQIAIDDFGTGYSSLAYLTQFAVDYLKIDQSFVSKLPDDEASAAVIGAIADMATRLGIMLVAEGVETEEQIEMLATLGAPRLQGYRFAKPRPAADIEHQLALRSGFLGHHPHDDADLLTQLATSAGPTN